VLKGNKPDFHDAMMGDISKPMYEDILKQLGQQYKSEAIKGVSNDLTSPSNILQVVYLEHT